jgi:hypothetical protein
MGLLNNHHIQAQAHPCCCQLFYVARQAPDIVCGQAQYCCALSPPLLLSLLLWRHVWLCGLLLPRLLLWGPP